MRLLEFGRDEGGANPLQTGRPDPADGAAVQKSPAATLEAPRPLAKPARNTRKARVFPIKPGNGQRKPIDLEQLQQRVEVLEKRIKSRTEALGDDIAKRDLELLKQRMKLLERNVNNELWAAKQREYHMLQLMAKPTLRMAIRQRYNILRGKTLPTGHAEFPATRRQPPYSAVTRKPFHSSCNCCRYMAAMAAGLLCCNASGTP